MIYVALQLDHQFNLITYLYYIKYVKSGNFSFFHHIDVNIECCAYKNHDVIIIQKSVLLNNKNKNNCTMILSNMH